MRSRLTGLIVAASVAGLLAIGPTLATPATATDRSVVVQTGDTLIAIARRFNVSVERIVALNHLANANRIYAGQRLQLIAAAPAAPAAAAPPARATSSPAAAAAVHVVRPGEHLTGIARQHGTSVAALAAANRLSNPSYIRVGQRLVIPSAATVPAQPASATPVAAGPAAPSSRSHRVAPGEYLIGIARRYGTSVQAIMAANGMSNPSFVRAGDVLRIPPAAGAAAPVAAAPAAAPHAAAIPASMAERVRSRSAVRDLIVAESRRFGVPASLALAVAWQESGWQQAVTSSAGALGVMQLLPATGDWVGGAMLHQRLDLRDVRHNVRAGVRLLAHYLDRYDGNREKVLAAYYQGQTAVDRHGIYNVTRPYIASILGLERIFR
jgi:N-acetylmuramoyl-L-alanine amidase